MNRCKKLLALLLACVMVLGLASCSLFEGKATLEDVRELVSDFELGDKFTVTMTVGLEGTKKGLKDKGEALLASSGNFLSVFDEDVFSEFDEDTEIEPGEVGSATIVYDGTGDEPVAKLTVNSMGNGLEMICTQDTAYMSTEVLLNMVLTMFGASTEDISELAKELPAYIEFGDADVTFSISDMSEMSDTLSEGLVDIQDMDEEDVTVERGDGDGTVYILTATDEKVAEVLEGCELTDLFEDEDVQVVYEVSENKGTYTMKVTIGTEDAGITTGVVVDTKHADVEVPGEDDVLTEDSLEDALNDLLYDVEIEDNEPEVDPGDSPEGEVEIITQPSNDTSEFYSEAPTKWLANSDKTVIDYESADVDLKYGSTQYDGSFEHRLTGVAKSYKQVYGPMGQYDAQEQVLIEYCYELFDTLADLGHEFEWQFESSELTEGSMWASATQEDYDEWWDYDIWFHRDFDSSAKIVQEIEVERTITDKTLAELRALDTVELSNQIADMTGLVIDSSDLGRLIVEALDGLEETQSGSYSVYVYSDGFESNDSLSIYVAEREYAGDGTVYISISASTYVTNY